MAIIDRSKIAKQLVPGLNEIFGVSYKQIGDEHKVLFDTEKSRRSYEEELLIAGLGSAVEKPEGAPIVYDDMRELYTARYVHLTIALGFQITEEAFEDNLYESFAKIRAQALGAAMARTKQQKAANIFNLGFSTNQLGGDGVPLFSNAHPTQNGVNQSNLISGNPQLSETALENAVIQTSRLQDDRGQLIGASIKSLHIPVGLMFTAKRILQSDLSTTTATFGSDGITNTNNKNVVSGFFPGGVHINHRFADDDAWFTRNDIPGGTKHFERVPLSSGDEGDFDTGNMKFKARERYSFYWSEWRQWLGSNGSGS